MPELLSSGKKSCLAIFFFIWLFYPSSGLCALPKLHVSRNEIKDENGKMVILRGINLADPHSLGKHFNEIEFKNMVRDWTVNIVRVPIHPRFWSHTYIQDYLIDLVSWGEKYKVYILLDYHDFGNPADRLELINQRWRSIASKFCESPAVLYDIFNEPHSISWAQWKNFAQEIIDSIRAVDPDSVIFVGGLDWGYNLSAVKDNPVERKNIVYSTHPYPIKTPLPIIKRSLFWESCFGYLAQTYPVFAGEWGFTNEKVGSAPAVYYVSKHDKYGQDLLRYMKSKRMHWTAWVMHPGWHPNLIKDWNYTPTNFGQLVKDYLKKERLLFGR